MENSNKSAFPCSENVPAPSNVGLTKREYFAAMAMQGLLANPALNTSDKFDLGNTCLVATEAADQLLKQLEA